MKENDILSDEEQIKLPKSDNNNSYKFHYNYNSPNYQKDLGDPKTYEINYNDIKQYNTSPKMLHNHANFRKINNIIPQHQCHKPHGHIHIHHSPQCHSHSTSPSPIKNTSQPLYHTYYNSNFNEQYELGNKNFLYNNDKINNSQNFFSDDLSNDFSNNNDLIQKINDNNTINVDKTEGRNHINALMFDDYMSKVVNNKYNKMKQFNESYYLRKQFGDETNYTNINNTFNDENIKEEFDIMKKNLEKKYKIYNLITKYDNIDLKNNPEENLEEEENKDNKENKDKKKSKKHKNRKKNKKKRASSSSEDSDFDSSPEKNNFVKDDNNNRNIIQKTFNENIGQKNSTYVSSTFNHIKEKDNDKNNNEPNINNSNLLEYLKKENEELKNMNNNYKQTLDTLFYFLNNVFHKYRKKDEENQNKEVFDLSKDINSIENLSKKLINLETLINDNTKNNNSKSNPLLIMTKENSIQLPDKTKLLKFNDLIEGINEKCFSFKEDNYIERYKNDLNKSNENNINNIHHISDININQKNEKEIINKINNENDKDKDKCVACLLGCNISKRGYSPMRYNPNNKKEKRRDDSGDLLDKFYEEKEKKNKSRDKRNI